MTSPLEPPYMTAEHFAAFGRIVHAFSRAEVLFEISLAHALKLNDFQATFVLSQYGYDHKRRLLANWVQFHGGFAIEFQKPIVSAIDAIQSMSPLRNNVAHCIWAKGASEGSIKPFFVSTKGKAILLGDEHNEKEWTADMLHAEATEVLERTAKLQRLLCEARLIPERFCQDLRHQV